MNDTATPKPPQRPTKFPAAIPRTMTTETQRRSLDELEARTGETLGALVRSLVDDGLMLREAYDADPDLREDVARLARESSATVAEAVATMLRFAVSESRRRTERNRRLAAGVATGLAEMGFEVDAVSVGEAELRLE